MFSPTPGRLFGIPSKVYSTVPPRLSSVHVAFVAVQRSSPPLPSARQMNPTPTYSPRERKDKGKLHSSDISSCL